jgi:hypothetical protein
VHAPREERQQRGRQAARLMSAPMTPEREAQIRALLDDEFRDGCQLTDALEEVLGELDRLRALHPQD